MFECKNNQHCKILHITKTDITAKFLKVVTEKLISMNGNYDNLAWRDSQKSDGKKDPSDLTIRHWLQNYQGITNILQIWYYT